MNVNLFVETVNTNNKKYLYFLSWIISALQNHNEKKLEESNADLSRIFRTSKSTIVRYLKKMRDDGLIDCEKIGNKRLIGVFDNKTRKKLERVTRSARYFQMQEKFSDSKDLNCSQKITGAVIQSYCEWGLKEKTNIDEIKNQKYPKGCCFATSKTLMKVLKYENRSTISRHVKALGIYGFFYIRHEHVNGKTYRKIYPIFNGQMPIVEKENELRIRKTEAEPMSKMIDPVKIEEKSADEWFNDHMKSLGVNIDQESKSIDDIKSDVMNKLSILNKRIVFRPPD